MAMYKLGGNNNEQIKVYFYRKAQWLALELYKNMRTKEPLFNFKDIDEMTVQVDHVLPTILTEAKVLQITDEKFASEIKTGKIFASNCSEEVELRAATITACDTLAKELREKHGKQNLSAIELEWILRKVTAKQESLKMAPKFKCKDTLFY